MDSEDRRRRGGRNKRQTNKQNKKKKKRDVGPLGVFNSQLPQSMTRSRNVLMRGEGQTRRAETPIDSALPFVFPFCLRLLPVMNKHDETSAPVIGEPARNSSRPMSAVTIRGPAACVRMWGWQCMTNLVGLSYICRAL